MTERITGRRRPPGSRHYAPALRAADDASERPETPRVVLLNAVESRPWRARELVRAAAALVAGVVGGTALAYGVSGAMTPRYEARAEVTYRLQSELGAGFLRQDRRLSTQIVAMTGRATLAEVANGVGVPVADVERAVSAAVVGDSEVLRVSVVDTDRDRALRIAERVRVVYLAGANGPADTAERERLEAELIELQALETTLVARTAATSATDVPATAADVAVETTPAAAAAAAARTELLAVRIRIDTVTDRLRAMARDAERLQPASALADVYLLADPVAPRRGLMAAGGALTGALVAAAGLVLWRQVTLHRGGRP